MCKVALDPVEPSNLHICLVQQEQHHMRSLLATSLFNSLGSIFFFFFFFSPEYSLSLLPYSHENIYGPISISLTTLKVPWAFASSILMSPGSIVHTTYKRNWPSILCLALLEISEGQRRIRPNILDLNLEKSEMVWLYFFSIWIQVNDPCQQNVADMRITIKIPL